MFSAPTTLNPGTYTFNFQYQTPYVAPSSYQGHKGKIWYRAIAYVEYPGMRLVPAEDVIRIFDVIAPLDLNNDSDARVCMVVLIIRVPAVNLST